LTSIALHDELAGYAAAQLFDELMTSKKMRKEKNN
jgi:hypothetical protein